MKEEKALKIIFTGGGSGGHIMPALAMIDNLTDYCIKNNIPLNLIYFGSKNGIEKKIIEKKGIVFKSISTGKLRRYFSFKNLRDLFFILWGIVQSIFLIKKIKPQLIISTGGFVSVPPVIGAKVNGIPAIIHEQTINAGLANKISGKFADTIAITFEESRKYFPQHKTILTGIPLRQDIFTGDREKAMAQFNFDNKLPVIYFTGGGLGCHLLNEVALDILPQLLTKTNVIYQTGKAMDNLDYKKMLQLKETLPQNEKIRFKVYDFIEDELPQILAMADLAISRSGAGTVNELTALKIPAIYIPLAIATQNEQYLNALWAVSMNGAIIIEEKNLTKEILYATILDILFTEKLSQMKKALTEKNFSLGNENMLELIKKSIKLNSKKR